MNKIFGLETALSYFKQCVVFLTLANAIYIMFMTRSVYKSQNIVKEFQTFNFDINLELNFLLLNFKLALIVHF